MIYTGLFGVDCEDFSDMLTLPCPGLDRTDASIFLHGACGVFALALHKEMGWDMVSLFDPDEDHYGYNPSHINFPVAHVFCMTENGLRADCRGMTDDEELFNEEFEEFFMTPGYYEFKKMDYVRFEKSLYEALGEQADILLTFAVDFIKIHKENYFTV